MAAVLLHGGMPKTGSTSIQFWLRDPPDLLAARGWHTVVDASGPGGVDYRFAAAGDAPNVTSNVFLLRYAAEPDFDRDEPPHEPHSTRNEGAESRACDAHFALPVPARSSNDALRRGARRAQASFNSSSGTPRSSRPSRNR